MQNENARIAAIIFGVHSLGHFAVNWRFCGPDREFSAGAEEVLLAGSRREIMHD